MKPGVAGGTAAAGAADATGKQAETEAKAEVEAAAAAVASVAAFPFALHNLSAKSITIGTGIFFGCFELAEGVISIMQH